MNSEVEIWKDLPEFEGIYQMSSMGRIKTLDRYITLRSNSKNFRKGKILKLSKNRLGYLFTTLFNGKIRKKNAYIHRLMAKTFLLDYKEELHVNHLNLIKTDNRVSNLQMCTHRENLTHWRKQKNEFTGASLFRDKKQWASCIRIKNKTHHLGLFATKELAHLEYKKALKILLDSGGE